MSEPLPGQWPNLIAPAKYDNPVEGWEDPKLPDINLIWKLAKEVGYAVGVHGSLKRDFDLIAVPWTDESVGCADFVAHLCSGLPAKRIDGPEHKPHGRVAVVLQLDGYYKHIDLSITPRLVKPINEKSPYDLSDKRIKPAARKYPRNHP